MRSEWLSELWSDVRYRLRALFDRDAVERELDAELRFHLEREVERHERAGLAPAEALRVARAEFGRLDRVKEASRRARGTVPLEAALHDLRLATRGLRADRTFTLGVVLTFALGIGANTAMFGIVDQLLFRPPAYLRDPGAVHRVDLVRDVGGRETVDQHFAYTRYLDLARWTTAASDVAAFGQRSLAVGTGDRARELPVATVSAGFFDFFDAPPVLGRFFTAREDVVPAGAPVVVLSYAYWQAAYGGRVDVIGQPLQVGMVASTIIGVAPPSFAGVPDGARSPLLFVPITSYAGSRTNFAPGEYYTTHRWRWVGMLVRRKPGVSAEQASADLTQALARSYDAERVLDPSQPARQVARPRAVAAPVQRDRGPTTSPTTTVAAWVSGVAIVVLIIAGANVANLLVARGLRRRRELALRLALGVGRGRLVGQLLAESVVLALLGGGAGVVVGHWGGLLLRQLFALDATAASLGDPRTLVFGGFVALAVGLLTGLAPALQAGREDPAATLKSGARDSGYRRSRLRSVLLVAQGALSVVLLIGAGWFVRSLQNVQALRLGYDVDPVLYVSTNMRGTRLTGSEHDALNARLRAEAAAMPGVVTAAQVTTIPFWNTWDERIFVPGIDSVERLGTFTLQASTPEYFQAMGTRVTRGRGLSTDDRAGAPPVIVVSESMADRLWPNADPIGRCVRVSADTAPCRTVVGIAEDAKQTSIAGPREMHYYLALDQFSDADGGDLVVRTRGAAAPFAEAIRRRLQPLMPGASYVTATPMRVIVSEQTRSWRLGATMFLALGALALVLAAVGLYSVLAYSVAQRSRELAVRAALGARRGDVLRLVVGEGARFAVAGIAIGAVLALAAGRWARALLFGVSPHDPGVLGTVVGVLLLVALAASVIPAWRATRVDPNVVLRAE